MILSPKTLWLPEPGPQVQAFLSPADILFYGGAAGGGKTDLLLGLAVNNHRHSRIFRRQYTQLRALIERSREILTNTTARYNSQQAMWRYVPGARLIEFAACQLERDKEKFKGRPADLIGFDEVCDFSETQVRYIIAWCRTVVQDQRCRVILTGNPPTTPEGEWIIEFFAPWLDEEHPNPAEPGELRWFAQIDDEEQEVEGPEPFQHAGETITPKSRSFIPAYLSDNVFLAQTGYESTLQALPEPLRSQLLLGIFRTFTEENPWQVIPTAWVQLAQARWKQRQDPRDARLPTSIGLDPARGGKDKTVISELYGTWFAPLHKYAGKDTPDGPSVAALIANLYNDYRNVADGWNEDFDATEIPINCDVIGIGSSAVDTLEGNDFYVNSVNFAEKSYETDRSGQLRLRNIRAEAYWGLREALDPDHGDNIALPPDRELLRDLTAPTYKLTISGILVESKKDIKARLGRSPDCGDAVVLAHYLADIGPIAVVL